MFCIVPYGLLSQDGGSHRGFDSHENSAFSTHRFLHHSCDSFSPSFIARFGLLAFHGCQCLFVIYFHSSAITFWSPQNYTGSCCSPGIVLSSWSSKKMAPCILLTQKKYGPLGSRSWRASYFFITFFLCTLLVIFASW